MKTINLLPKTRQQELKLEALLGSLKAAIWLSVAGFLAVILAQVAVQLYLQSEEHYITASVEQLQAQDRKQENAQLKKQITHINNIIDDYKTLSFEQPKWSKVIKAFSGLPPDGVVISSFTVNFDKKSVYITGTAPTRDLVIQLYNNILSDNKDFYNIDYPLENVAQPKNINFHFQFYIQDSLLK